MNNSESALPLLIEEMITKEYNSDCSLNSDTDDKCEIDIEISNVKTGFQLPISQSTASEIYKTAGTEENEVNGDICVTPSPHAVSTADEQLIFKMKEELGVNHDLDSFQVQSLVALLNGRNVVLVAPCGSGKLLVFYLAVKILRVKYDLPNGVGLCLQPLNNILWKKFKIFFKNQYFLITSTIFIYQLKSNFY